MAERDFVELPRLPEPWLLRGVFEQYVQIYYASSTVREIIEKSKRESLDIMAVTREIARG